LEDCPVHNPRFCGVATKVVNAIASGDADTIVELSWSWDLDCHDIVAEVFPACQTQSTLSGYEIAHAGPTFEVLTQDQFRARLEAAFANIDPSFSDDHGGGSLEVLGIGRCGGSYDIAWTAAVGNGEAPADRLISVFELSRETDSWVSDVWYSYASEDATMFGQQRPVEEIIAEAGCGAASNPWPGIKA
jgi:hypothetical protein